MADKGEETSEETINPENALKKKRSQRSQRRRRITLAIKRIREILDKDQVHANNARLGKEIIRLRKDYEFARKQNGELYDLLKAEEQDTLDQWENDLAYDVFSIEEEVEVSLIALEENQVNTSGSVEDASHASNTSGSVGDANHSSNADDSVGEARVQPDPAQNLTIVENHAGHTSSNNVEAQQTIQTSKQPPVSHQVALNVASKGKLEHARSFDFWIDDLLEFQETVLPKSGAGNVTIADALFKLELIRTFLQYSCLPSMVILSPVQIS